MISVVINFPVPEDITPEAYKDKMKDTVPRYQNIPGLMRKNYIFNEKSRVGGGIYNFDNLEDAKACFDEAWQKRVETNFGKPEITYFDTLIELDNVLNTVKVNDE